MKAWADAGLILFSGVNVPSKAFGEFVEHERDTPNIDAAGNSVKILRQGCKRRVF